MSTTEESRSRLEEYSRAGGTNRFPRVITREEIMDLPFWNFSRGLGSRVFISRERDDARYFVQGLQFHAADLEDFEWEQDAWDEGYYVIEGVMRVLARDGAGKEVTLEAKEGQHMYLPAGFWYTIKPSGVETISFWTVAPNLKRGLSPLVELNLPEAPEYSKKLTELRSTVRGNSND